MCRIVGRVSKENDLDFKDRLKSMLESVKNGGPDDEGTYFSEGVALGHRRLSIIDLSKAGHQPMISEDSNLAISFNGEIYNYLVLKRELEEAGYSFNTKTDTEVILRAYEVWGTNAFDRLDGIFAFALHDKKKNFFFLVRDHIGIKPLYYCIDENELLFSSEVKAFSAIRKDWKKNEDWPIFFLAFGSIPYPYTTLSNVTQLSPGSYLRLDLKSFKYNSVIFYQPNGYDYTIKSNDEALAQMQLAIQKAIQKNLIADAQLGIFLSGGIDSSLLTLLADKFLDNVRTLSVNFDDTTYDEYPFQQLIISKAENVEHTSHHVTEHMFWEHLDDIWKSMDQPSIDAINTYFISKFAKIEGIKCVLSGLGADEIFGGYASFKRIRWMKIIRKIPNKRAIGILLSKFKKSWGRLVYLTLPGMIGDYLFLRGIHTPSEISRILKLPEDKIWEVLNKIPINEPSKMAAAEYASLLETKIYLSNQLLKDTDYMGMWHGVEIRVPFLDVELLKRVRLIPPSIRYNSKWPKYLLTASNEHVLPRKIIFRRKKGFTFPFSMWMHRSSKRFRKLMPLSAETDIIFAQFKNGSCHWSKCWSLAVLKRFA